MKKFIETLKNCWRVEDLRQRLLITLLFTAIYRFGSFIVLPGIDPNELGRLQSQTAGGLMSLLDMFSGGAFSNASIFALGIMPYISASIVMQLLAVAVPYFQKLQREGESGRKKNQLVHSYPYGGHPVLPGSVLSDQPEDAGIGCLGFGVSWTYFMIPATFILAAGSMFILWLGERITDKGVGNGISLIIMIGIIARLPQAFIQEVSSRFTAITSGGLVMFIVELIILYAVVCASILLTQGTRKVPVQYAKRVVGNRQYGGARQYIPLKLFAANVMPIIFAQALMFIPLAIVQYSTDNVSPVLQQLLNNKSLLYNCVYVVLVIAFTYFLYSYHAQPCSDGRGHEAQQRFHSWCQAR